MMASISCRPTLMKRQSVTKRSSTSRGYGCLARHISEIMEDMATPVLSTKPKERAHNFKLMDGTIAGELDTAAPSDIVNSSNGNGIGRVTTNPNTHLIVKVATDATKSTEVEAADAFHARGRTSEEDIKSICKNWRSIITQRRREEARRKIEAMTCTAGFQENLQSMLEFEKLLGIKTHQWTI